MKIKDVKRGEATVPEIVTTLFQNLIGRPNVRRWERKNQINERGSCIWFLKPQKNFMLGIALKRLTGSRKVSKIMNRLRYCAIFHTIEEVETETTFKSTKPNVVTPIGMKLNPRCGTGVAWDNTERFVETITGKETLHNAAGILYQTITEEEPMDQERGDDENLLTEEETCCTREDIEAIYKTLHKKKRR